MHYDAEVVCRTGALTLDETIEISQSLGDGTPVINDTDSGMTTFHVTVAAAAVAQAAMDALASVAAVVDSPIVGLHVTAPSTVANSL